MMMILFWPHFKCLWLILCTMLKQQSFLLCICFVFITTLRKLILFYFETGTKKTNYVVVQYYNMIVIHFYTLWAKSCKNCLMLYPRSTVIFFKKNLKHERECAGCFWFQFGNKLETSWEGHSLPLWMPLFCQCYTSWFTDLWVTQA